MEGNIKFEDALAARLGIIQPSKEAIAACLTNHPFRLSPGIDRLIDTLNKNGTDVFLVSGGFRIMIEPIAKSLCVAKSNIIANTILFDQDGNYSGFDRSEPTSKDMGKPEAIKRIKQHHGYETIVMVGDGATDAQAKPPADAFIGFGGVVVREAVKNKACWYVFEFDSMTEVLHKYGKKKLN
jgi:phosphoserine phosphatase